MALGLASELGLALASELESDSGLVLGSGSVLGLVLVLGSESESVLGSALGLASALVLVLELASGLGLPSRSLLRLREHFQESLYMPPQHNNKWSR